jgi:sugar O-acyltransferase (sialic acid O-acetyltransferase NeuD family)
MKQLVIIGSGAFSREVLSWAKDIQTYDNILIAVTPEYYNNKSDVHNLDDLLNSNVPYEYVIAIANPVAKQTILDNYGHLISSWATLIHPNVIITDKSSVKIGVGTIICANSILTTNITIGAHVHLNLASTVGHDTFIGNYVTTAPAVNISGNNIIEYGVYFGTNSCTREKLFIASNSVIGMGAVVVKDILESGVYVGNPARKMK